jgi:hypothetical protein
MGSSRDAVPPWPGQLPSPLPAPVLLPAVRPTDQVTPYRRPAAPEPRRAGPVRRWRRVFPARYDQAVPASEYVARLVGRRPDWQEITAAAAGLATTGIGHATRAGHEFFVAGVDWSGSTVAVMAAPVSRDGLVTGPVLRAHFTPGPQVQWDSPLSGLPLPAQATELGRRFPGWHVWFGSETRQWWAIRVRKSPNDRLVCAPTADSMADRLQAELPG